MATNANANGIPFLKSKRLGIPDPIKDSIVVWYDIKRQGATNESMSQNPILKDLSGHGHDATCYNFAWNRQSGISSYFDFNLLKYDANWNDYVKDVTETSFIYYRPGNDISVMVNSNNYVVYPFQIKVTGITDTGLRLEYGQGTIPETESSIKTDGVYTITSTAYGGFKLYGDESITCNIKIEQIAYPNALVFDGVNDYCRVDGLPILTDYTVITKRKYINTDADKPHCFASKSTTFGRGAFIIDEHAAHKSFTTYSFGQVNAITLPEDEIIYITPTSYNGDFISKGNNEDDDILWIGQLRTVDVRRFTGALYSFVLFNRTLTEDEIKKWIRQNMDENYLLPNERPIIYYDFRNGDNSNLNTVTDLSGNERHGTMYNFTGEANSGYSDGCLKFNGIDNYIKIPYSDDAVYKTVIMLLKITDTDIGIAYDARYYDSTDRGIALFFNRDSAPYLSGRILEGGVIYINGLPNTSYTNIDMLQKKNCVAVTSDVNRSGSAAKSPRIGTTRSSTTYSLNFSLYAFLGFDKILTEEEIRYVMNKYNLLEGIDEI